MDVILRSVDSNDGAFLLRVYASTREQEMAIVPWTFEQKDAFIRSQFLAQTTHYNAKYPEAEHSIIVRDGQQVGRIFLARLPKELAIADITILPEFRNAGTGSFVLKRILNEALQSAKSVEIYVEPVNPSMRLFQRLGFRKVGEEGFNFLMKWNPPSQGA